MMFYNWFHGVWYRHISFLFKCLALSQQNLSPYKNKVEVEVMITGSNANISVCVCVCELNANIQTNLAETKKKGTEEVSFTDFIIFSCKKKDS